MAHVWKECDGKWSAKSLSKENDLDIGFDDVVVEVVDALSNGKSNQRPKILGAGQDLAFAWFLLMPDPKAVSVNGDIQSLAICQLKDRDELMARTMNGDSQRLYFSAEDLARIELYPLSKKAKCPRCKQDIEQPAAAVRCPACNVWHHQSDDSNCWTYAEHCAACHEQATDLQGTYRWTPEDLS